MTIPPHSPSNPFTHGYGRVRVIESRVVHPLALRLTTPFPRPAVKSTFRPRPLRSRPLPRRPSRTTRRAVVPRSVRLTFTRVVHEGSSTVYRLLACSNVRALSSLSRVSVARRRFRHPRRRVATAPATYLRRPSSSPIRGGVVVSSPGFSPRDQLRAGRRLRLGRYPRKTFLQHVQHFLISSSERPRRVIPRGVVADGDARAAAQVSKSSRRLEVARARETIDVRDGEV